MFGLNQTPFLLISSTIVNWSLEKKQGAFANLGNIQLLNDF